MKKILIIVISFITILSIVGCENTKTLEVVEPTNANVIKERETYKNNFDETKIPGQWENYGIGDPFVMRYNGVYYLYASTKDSETGVRAWTSIDLMNWTQVNNPELNLGYVSEHEITKGAYAPEVIHVNGKFYMITSPGGNGHYILEADSPIGPFKPISQNLGKAIDGSFFMDDNEQLYLTTADASGIKIYQMNDDMTIGKSTLLQNTQIGSWTEGPYILNHNGNYFLTFTGNHVTSASYKVGYSYSEGNVFDKKSYNYGDNIILNTSDEFNGLGHSSTVLGPNMDSYYIAYHNLINAGGPTRGFNLNRLFFNGNKMVVDNQSLISNYVPQMPDFSSTDAKGLNDVNNKFLTTTSTLDTFTAEYNFIGDNQKMIFDYKDNSNYSYINVNGASIKVVKVENSNEEEVTSVTLTKNYDFTKLHTIRVAYNNSKLDVYFDEMGVIRNFSANFRGGKIGYFGKDNLEIYYTAFSNYAKGTSDNDEIKTNAIQANSYDLIDSKLTGKSGLQPVNTDGVFNYINNAYEMFLANQGDYVKYALRIIEEGFYGIDFILDKKYCGHEVLIQIDESTPKLYKIPNISTEEQYINVTVCESKLPSGTHFIKIISKDQFGFTQFDLFKSCKSTPKFEHNLASYITKGAYYVNSWKIRDSGHHALSGNRQLMYLGDDQFTDFTISADLMFLGETQTSTAGFILRADNPSFSIHDTNESIQGYYVGINNSKVFISRYNYNLSYNDIVADVVDLDSNELVNLKASIVDNTINVYVNDNLVLTYTDSLAFTHGKLGFYTEGAATIYKNLKINKGII